MKSDFVVLPPELLEETRKAVKVLEAYRLSLNDADLPPEVLASFCFLTTELAGRIGTDDE